MQKQVSTDCHADKLIVFLVYWVERTAIPIIVYIETNVWWLNMENQNKIFLTEPLSNALKGEKFGFRNNLQHI